MTIMSPHLRRDALGSRAVLVGLALATAFGLVALVERIGVPVEFVVVLVHGITLFGLLGVAVACGSMRIAEFFFAGHAIPALPRRLATLALWAGAVLPLIDSALAAAHATAIYAGLVGGLAFTVWRGEPWLQRGQAFSLARTGRLRLPLRLALVAAIAAASLFAAIAGLDGAATGLSRLLGMEAGPALVLAAVCVGVIGTMGGLGSLVFVAVATLVLALASLAVPVGLSFLPQFQLPASLLADQRSWAAATEQLAALRPVSAPSALDDPLLVFAALALGIGCLPPLLAPSAAAPDTAYEAQRGAAVPFVLGAILAVLGAAAVAQAALALEPALVGRSPERLPAWAYTANASGLITLCGRQTASPAALKTACQAAPGFAGTLRPQDVKAAGGDLLMAFPQIRGLGATLAAAIGAASVALSLILAAAGFFAAAATVAQEAVFPLLFPAALASPRLAVGRGLYLAALLFGAARLWHAAPSPQTLIATAAALSCACIAPLVLLSPWKRLGPLGSLMTLLAGFATLAPALPGGDVSAVLTSSGYGFGVALAVGVLAIVSNDRGKNGLPSAGKG
jgi:cation/acetate symporter